MPDVMAHTPPAEPAAKDPLLAFSGADLEDFEATLSCALDGGCEMWHAELRGNSTTDENALPCLVDAACAAKYSALAKRMQRAPQASYNQLGHARGACMCEACTVRTKCPTACVKICITERTIACKTIAYK